MSVSPEFVELSGKKAARMPEKWSFSQRCNLLSQYYKEKGSFGDLNLGMTCNSEGNGNGTSEMLRQTATTMNLFPMNEKQIDFSSRNITNPPADIRSMDLFSHQAGFAPYAPKEDVQKSLAHPSINKRANTGSQTAQMTIFYGGQVIVFDDFPADKAKKIMLLASKGSKGSSQGLTATGFPSLAVKSLPAFAHSVAKPPVESKSPIPSTSNAVPNFSNNLIQERIQPPPQTVATDLPIARRASLHRFLEKRKDRITARAPYQLGGSSATPSKPNESKPWLGLAAQPSQ